MMRKPVVSISCLTFNHVTYIADCIEGFLMQKTSFSFEVLIHDDASTDGTEAIIREYERKYPDIIKPLYERENQWQKGRRGSEIFNFPRAQGKYIALCEGDDYWTDPFKLQKQVDYMELNPDCSLCFHASKSIRDNNPDDFVINRPKSIPKDNKFEMKDAILGGGGFMATNSMLFLRRYINFMPSFLSGDAGIMIQLSRYGKIGYIDELMSVYRIMTPGSWSASMKDVGKRKIHHYATLKWWDKVDELTHYKYHKYIVLKKLKNRFNYLKNVLRHSILDI